MANVPDMRRSINKCFPCLPHLKNNSIKAKPESGTDNRRVSSLDTNINFITIENTFSDHLCKFNHDDEVEDDNFITLERGLVQAQSCTRPPSHDSASSEDVEIGKDFSQCKSLATMIYEEFEVDQVEDEFLRMLDSCRGRFFPRSKRLRKKGSPFSTLAVSLKCE